MSPGRPGAVQAVVVGEDGKVPQRRHARSVEPSTAHAPARSLVLEAFERAFERGLLTPHEAARLRGKTFFSLSAGCPLRMGVI